MNAVAFVHEQLTNKAKLPVFKAGDNITVNYKIVEGNKERINVWNDIQNKRIENFKKGDKDAEFNSLQSDVSHD